MIVLAMLVVPALFPALPALATSWTVTNTNDNGAGSLRAAIANATSGDTINFSSSVTGTITLTSGELAIAKNLTITGPGAASLAISGNSASRVFNISSGASVVISGLTFHSGSAGASYGGGIFNAGALTLSNSTLSGNSEGSGGGILNFWGTAVLTNSAVSGNSSANGWGGGIFNQNGTLTFTNGTLSGNSAAYGGGGIYNYGTLTLTNSTVSGNSSTNGGGGGIFSEAGTLTLSNSTLSGNSATHGGGIWNHVGSTLTLINSTLFGNSSPFYGGGIRNLGTATLTNTTLSGNSATFGGGAIANVDFFGSKTMLRNTTVANSPSGGNCCRHHHRRWRQPALAQHRSGLCRHLGRPQVGPLSQERRPDPDHGPARRQCRHRRGP
ncbi:MAG: hypothetical protein EXR51_00410 [Dehalococcoidia bacterium]|nr:hypothetical protein [Dehalococcoidia bacterium]